MQNKNGKFGNKLAVFFALKHAVGVTVLWRNTKLLPAFVGINSNELTFNVYPNPSNDGNTRLDFNATSEGQLDLQVFDATGRTVASQSHFVNGISMSVRVRQASY